MTVTEVRLMRKVIITLLFALACTALTGCRLSQRIESGMRGGIESGSVPLFPGGIRLDSHRPPAGGVESGGVPVVAAGSR
jgi:hypothetical protein